MCWSLMLNPVQICLRGNIRDLQTKTDEKKNTNDLQEVPELMKTFTQLSADTLLSTKVQL